MTKMVSVGNSVSLDCIDTQEPNVAISWTKGNGRNTQSIGYARRSSGSASFYSQFKGEVSPNNNVDWVSRKQFYKPNSNGLSRFG